MLMHGEVSHYCFVHSQVIRSSFKKPEEEFNSRRYFFLCARFGFERMHWSFWGGNGQKANWTSEGVVVFLCLKEYFAFVEQIFFPTSSVGNKRTGKIFSRRNISTDFNLPRALLLAVRNSSLAFVPVIFRRDDQQVIAFSLVALFWALCMAFNKPFIKRQLAIVDASFLVVLGVCAAWGVLHSRNKTKAQNTVMRLTIVLLSIIGLAVLSLAVWFISLECRAPSRSSVVLEKEKIAAKNGEEVKDEGKEKGGLRERRSGGNGVGVVEVVRSGATDEDPAASDVEIEM